MRKSQTHVHLHVRAKELLFNDFNSTNTFSLNIECQNKSNVMNN